VPILNKNGEFQMTKLIIKNLNALKYGIIWRFPALRDLYHKIDFHLWRFPKFKKSTPLFKHLNIETTNICTKRCSFCYFGNLSEMPKRELMSEELFKKIIGELIKIEFKGRISLYEINEPLTDPRIFDFIAYIKKKMPNVFQLLSTNGDLLTNEKLDKLFYSGLDKIIINAYTKKDLEKIKKLLKNYNYKGNSIILYDKTKKYVTKIWTSRGGSIKKYKKDVSQKTCELIYVQMIVKSDGEVVSCVNDMWRKQVMGNLNDASIEEVWFGEKFEKLRKELEKGNRKHSILCSQCDYVGAGGYLKQYKRN
jgi:radical SAM protein with 4Fe4S-binding SPASM domain